MLALIENENLIGIGDRRQPVRDDERRAAAAKRVEGPLDLGLRLGIERARCLIEDEDRRVLQDGARDGDALALAARQRGAALADHEVIAAGLAHDEVVRLREPRCVFDFRVRRVRSCRCGCSRRSSG